MFHDPGAYNSREQYGNTIEPDIPNGSDCDKVVGIQVRIEDDILNYA
jgi:hypothetical protein